MAVKMSYLEHDRAQNQANMSSSACFLDVCSKQILMTELLQTDPSSLSA